MLKLFNVGCPAVLAVLVTGCPVNEGCVYQGEMFADGESFPDADGCNTCTCNAGKVLCTVMGCIEDVCSYQDVDYAAGETFPDVDGCNTCTCESDGSVACTTMDCLSDPCDEGFVWYEPGCGEETGLPVIEAGCYAPCEGAPCESGLCQLADINPCVCAEGGDCCDACGALEWLCLDPPVDSAACTPFDETVPALTGAQNSFGECGEGCVSSLTFSDSETEGCPTARLTVCDTTAGETCSTDNSGILTALGHARVVAAAAELQGVSLEEVYGCPDCADGGATRLSLRRDGGASTVVYEFQNPPDELVTADALTQGLMQALITCTATEDILILSADCTPHE